MTAQPTQTTAATAAPRWYYRDGARWVCIVDPRQAPRGVRVWSEAEMVIEDGKARAR